MDVGGIVESNERRGMIADGCGDVDRFLRAGTESDAGHCERPVTKLTTHSQPAPLSAAVLGPFKGSDTLESFLSKVAFESNLPVSYTHLTLPTILRV